MHALLLFNTLCASQGDGLSPEFVALLERPPATVEASMEIAELIRRHAKCEREAAARPPLRLPTS
jgi:hypothetical protein